MLTTNSRIYVAFILEFVVICLLTQKNDTKIAKTYSIDSYIYFIKKAAHSQYKNGRFIILY